MNVRELMTSDASFCRRDTSLAEAAVKMWQRDCGVLPVVDEQHKAVGMITDRDICIAVAMQNRRASEIAVGEIARGEIAVCRADDDAESALKTMKKRQIRRLAVVGANGALLGVLSISDFLRRAGKGKDCVSRKKVFAALREISSFRPVQLHELIAENAESIIEDAPPDDEPARRAASDNQLETSENRIAENSNLRK